MVPRCSAGSTAPCTSYSTRRGRRSWAAPPRPPPCPTWADLERGSLRRNARSARPGSCRSQRGYRTSYWGHRSELSSVLKAHSQLVRPGATGAKSAVPPHWGGADRSCRKGQTSSPGLTNSVYGPRSPELHQQQPQEGGEADWNPGRMCRLKEELVCALPLYAASPDSQPKSNISV